MGEIKTKKREKKEKERKKVPAKKKKGVRGDFCLSQKKPRGAVRKPRARASQNKIDLSEVRSSLLGCLLENKESAKTDLGRTYRAVQKLDFWNRKIKSSFKKVLKFSLRLTYRASIFSLMAFLIYSISPMALSAPQSRTITTKEDWDQGELTSIDSEGHGTNIDSIQLSSGGSWKARVWPPSPDAISFGHASVMAGNYLYVFRGYSDNAFWRYDTVNSTWEELPDLPQPAHTGADMAYVSSQNKIYAIFGGYSLKFYEFDIESQSWNQLDDLLDSPLGGAAIETDGTDLFVIRGNGTSTFWKYDVSDGNWGNLDPVPAGATVGTGADLVSGQNGYLYLVRGNGTLNFYRYNITTRDWETTVASLPATCGGNCTMSGEQKGTYWTDGSIKYLYFMRSNATAHFLRYQIDGASANTWTLVSASEAIPGTTNYTSLAYNQNDGNIYAIRGNGTQELWKFNPSLAVGSQWVGPKQVQSTAGVVQTVGTGGDLIWDGSNYVYAVRGGNTTGFYRYTISTNTWTDQSVVSYGNVNNDVKGTFYSGSVYFPRYGSTSVYTYNGTAWAAIADLLPGAIGEGGGLAYNAGNSRIYALRGGGNANLYYRPVAGGVWQSAANVSLSDGGTTVNYFPNIGARIVSNGTDLYAMAGDGETAFLRHNTGANTWSKLSPTPFAQYYGTDMTYNSTTGKIYALAGYYKDETWEYDIAGDSWRRLPNNMEYSFGRGPYNGASLEYAGGSSLYATTGQGFTDMWSYTVEANNFKSSGSYVSPVMDLSNVASWVSLTANYAKPANTNIVYETMTSSDNVNWPGSWDTLTTQDESGGAYIGTINSDENRYMKVRITLSTSDGVSTPKVSNFSISYNSSDNPPVNGNSVVASSQAVGGAVLNSGESYDFAHPYFSWSGATDNGSGIAGYYVCFKKDADCADPQTSGTFQSGSTYLVNESLAYDSGESYGTYHLKIKAKDNNGNVASSVWDAFTYIYTGVSPTLSAQKTTQADFESGTLTNLSSTAASDSLKLEANASGFWNQTRVSLEPGAVYQGAELAQGSCQGNSNHCLYTTRGNSLSPYTQFQYYTIETDTWAARASTPLAVGIGATSTEGPAGYLYSVRGGGNSDFWLYDISANTWSTLESVPGTVTYGANMSYDGSRYVYLMPGNDDALYKFDTCNGAEGGCTQGWTTLSNANFDNPNTADGQRVYEGSDSVFAGSALYATQGNYYPYFAKYQITDAEQGTGSWTPLAQAPVGFYNGGTMTYDQETNSIFALAGNARLKFFKYSIDSNEWTELPDSPVTISWGASMSVYDGYIYIQRGGNTTNFYRYNIEENSWELPKRGFFGPIRQDGGNYYAYGTGTAMDDDGAGNLFVVRGLYDNTFGKYNTATGTFSSLAKLPVGAYAGSSIIYNEDENAVYYVPGAVRTTRTSYLNYFFKYNVATNTWSEVSARPPLQVTTGSNMTYDGSRYIYLTQGGNTNVWWRYDTCNGQGVCTPGWSAALPTIVNFDQRDGGKILYKNGYIYAIRGAGYTNFFRCDTSLLPASCWSAVSDSLPVGGTGTGGMLVDGQDGYIYAVRGTNTNNYYRWPVTGGAWQSTPTIPLIPAQVNTGGVAVNSSNRNWLVPSQGTNTYYDALYDYVIGSGSNGTGFQKTGSYVSEAMDLTSVYRWANLTTNYTLPANTFLTIETRTSSDETACENSLCENKSWSSWTQVSNDHTSGSSHVLNINSSPDDFIQVRINFTSSDRIFSPTLTDFSISYYQDVESPTNPSEATAYSSSAKTTPITNELGDSWYAHTAPYFEWPEVDVAGGARDNAGGSGVAGYYVCFGVDDPMDEDKCQDALADGIFQTNNYFQAPAFSSGDSGKTYYLRIKAVDNADMPAADSFTGFAYNLDLTPPELPTNIVPNPAGYSSSSQFTFSWDNNASDAHSGVLKYQYRLGDEPSTTWHDVGEPDVLSQIVEPYQPNENNFYLKVLDKAGNEVISPQRSFFWSGGAASPPQNVTVDPSAENNPTNSFTFTWDIPESYAGTSDNITYFYSVNYLPTPFNTVETKARGAGPGPFATQFGKNTFYIVAMSEGGSKTNPNDVDWDHPAEVSFYAKTAAPNPPTNVQSFDTSNRESQEYSVAVKWSPPVSVDQGNFAGYVIYRSEDNSNFTEVATTTGSAYVDVGLQSKLYYYYVKAKDKTNNHSIATSTASLTPTGRYTTAPTIVAEPKVVVQSYQAIVTWSTNRVASSFIEYGTGSGLGETTGQVDSLTEHSVEVTGLKAGTKYFYRAKFIDPDGNIGTSEILNFTTLPPPTISEVQITEIGLNTATISWQTNTSAKCTLNYGAGSLSSKVEEISGSTTHIEKLTGLISATIYNLQIEAIDSDLNSFNSDEYSFTTLEQARVADLTVQNKENVDIPTVVVNYKTNKETSTFVKFKSSSEGSFHNFLSEGNSLEHEATLEGLEPSIEYEIVATGIDVNGIEAASQTLKINTLYDSRPPGMVGNRAVGRVVGRGKDARANLYVKIETDELTKTKILFGKGTILNNFEQSTAEDPANTYHLVTIPVDPGQVYSYIVEAVDEANNKTTTKPVTVVVEGAKENATEIVVNTFSSKFGWLQRIWNK